MSTLSDLKKLHEKGLALIYLEPKKKKPIEAKWTTQKPKSWDELENSHDKSYNVGVRLGEPSKLISGKYLGAIDCDVKALTRKAKIEMNDKLRELGIDLNSAPIVMSGRGNGSKHIYVQTDKPMRAMKFAQSQNKVKVLMPGEGNKPHSKHELETLTPEERAAGYRIRAAWEISFMGTGQQTVLPPSIHPDTSFKYAWANPLMVKYLPSFEPKKFVTSTLGKVSSGGKEFKFKAVDVELEKTGLSSTYIDMIETGEGCENRSDALLSISMAMCRHKMTDNQILSVLSDESHWIGRAAYEHTQTGDRGKAVQWLYKYTLLKARHETDIMRRFDNPPSFAKLSVKQVEEQVSEVKAELENQLPDIDGKGKPKVTLRNVVHVLEKFLSGGLCGFDEFSNRLMFLKDTPYGGKKGREIKNQDDLELKHYLATHYRFEPSKETCFEAHCLIAQKYAYHPVKAYLEGLEWDGQARLDTWLKTAFCASGPRLYLNAVSRKVLVAAVARVFEPGCKFDYVMILEGPQGKFKSTALRILASAPWFTDGIGEIYQKDVVDQMTGKWIIELGEAANIRKSEIENVKAFITRQVDRVRPPYGRRSEDFPRQSIFIGSTNNSEYFTDETGNRRFWPVETSDSNFKWLKDNRDQLWAEAVMRYQLGETLYLSRELEEIAHQEQEKRFDVDEWEPQIKTIIQDDKTGGPFVTTELWRALHLTKGDGHPPMMDTKRIGKIMHRLGYRRTVKRINNVRGKCWVLA